MMRGKKVLHKKYQLVGLFLPFRKMEHLLFKGIDLISTFIMKAVCQEMLVLFGRLSGL